MKKGWGNYVVTGVICIAVFWLMVTFMNQNRENAAQPTQEDAVQQVQETAVPVNEDGSPDLYAQAAEICVETRDEIEALLSPLPEETEKAFLLHFMQQQPGFNCTEVAE